MTRERLPQRPGQRQKRGNHCAQPALETTRRGDADQLPHEKRDGSRPAWISGRLGKFV
jgi:hypothetical protein